MLDPSEAGDLPEEIKDIPGRFYEPVEPRSGVVVEDRGNGSWPEGPQSGGWPKDPERSHRSDQD